VYVCEGWSFAVTEERRLSVSENKVLSRTFGPKRQKKNGTTGSFIICSLVSVINSIMIRCGMDGGMCS